MPSTTVADYQVLGPSTFTLSNTPGEDTQLLDFTLPSDFAHSNGVRRPILAFKIRVLENDTSFTASVNGNPIFTISGLDASHTRGYWEPFSAEDAFPEGVDSGSSPNLTIHVGQGGARFNDVVLWYQIRRNP